MSGLPKPPAPAKMSISPLQSIPAKPSETASQNLNWTEACSKGCRQSQHLKQARRLRMNGCSTHKLPREVFVCVQSFLVIMKYEWT